MRRENLVALRLAYDALVKAGNDSLQAAYNFGQIVDALSNMYTAEVLGQEIGRCAATIRLYARLYRRYPTAHALLHMAREIGTYDVGRLSGNAASIRAQYVHVCLDCGSYHTQKQRLTDELTAMLESSA